MGYRNRKITTKIITFFAVLCVLLFPENLWPATYEHFIYQVRKTNGDVAPGVNVNVYTPGTSTRFTVYNNITGTVVKSQPMITDSLGNVDFYVGDSVVDILFTGGTIPTYKLLNVTLTALATAGVLTVPNGGTGAATFTLNTVLLGNGTLPIKTSSVGLANQVFRVPAAGGQPDFGTVNLSSSAAVSGVLPTANGGTGSSSGSSLSVQEVDGSPNVSGVINIKVTDGTLTNNGGGSVTIDAAPPFSDTIPIVKGSSDVSKLLRFEVDGFTAATTRTVTFPNASIVAAATDFLNLWGDGIKQTFNPNGTNAGFNVGAHTADPSVGVNGDQYYDSVLDKFRCHENGSWGDCISAGTSPGGATTNVQYNDAGAFGGDADFIFDDTNKFVGIGVQSALTDEGLSVASSGTHNGVVSSQRADADAPPGNSAGFRAYKSRGTIGTPTAVQSGDWMLGLSSNGHDGTGFFGTARAFTEATQTHTNSAHGTRWVFSTNPDGSTTITDTFRLPQDGGIQILTGTKPTCDSTKRGYIFFVAGGAGVADTYEACDKDVADVYAWRDIHASGSSGGTYTPNTEGLHEIVATPGLASGGFSTRTLGFATLDPASAGASFGNGDRAEGPFARAATGGLINQECGWYLGTAQIVQPRWGGELVLHLYIQGVAGSVRIAAGLSDAGVGTVPSILDATTNARNQAYFSYDTSVDGTAFWRTVTSNAGANTRTATTVAIANDTVYTLRISFAAGTYSFYIDDVLTNTHTTNLPTSSTTIGVAFGVKNLAANGSNVNLGKIIMWY
jgi:hypothetical protein